MSSFEAFAAKSVEGICEKPLCKLTFLIEQTKLRKELQAAYAELRRVEADKTDLEIKNSNLENQNRNLENQNHYLENQNRNLKNQNRNPKNRDLKIKNRNLETTISEAWDAIAGFAVASKPATLAYAIFRLHSGWSKPRDMASQAHKDHSRTIDNTNRSSRILDERRPWIHAAPETQSERLYEEQGRLSIVESADAGSSISLTEVQSSASVGGSTDLEDMSEEIAADSTSVKSLLSLARSLPDSLSALKMDFDPSLRDSSSTISDERLVESLSFHDNQLTNPHSSIVTTPALARTPKPAPVQPTSRTGDPLERSGRVIVKFPREKPTVRLPPDPSSSGKDPIRWSNSSYFPLEELSFSPS
ncbi:MAG: hypothetical protein Q9227_000667 [Pyrenula ochraceoflavens]